VAVAAPTRSLYATRPGTRSKQLTPSSVTKGSPRQLASTLVSAGSGYRAATPGLAPSPPSSARRRHADDALLDGPGPPAHLIVIVVVLTVFVRLLELVLQPFRAALRDDPGQLFGAHELQVLEPGRLPVLHPLSRLPSA
jgi:hypothetical protein